MGIPFRQYKQIIKERAREMRKNPTRGEKSMWAILRMGRINGFKFLRQHPILHHQNNRVYFFIADFYCHELRLIVEVDGDVHDKKEQQEYDQMRTEVLVEMGYQVIRFKNEHVIEHGETVVQRIQEYLL